MAVRGIKLFVKKSTVQESRMGIDDVQAEKKSTASEKVCDEVNSKLMSKKFTYIYRNIRNMISDYISIRQGVRTTNVEAKFKLPLFNT